MQFLVRGTPELSVQFLNDMIINATEKKGPIHILLRIPDFHVVKQDDLEIISTEEDKLKMKKKGKNTGNMMQYYTATKKKNVLKTI